MRADYRSSTPSWQHLSGLRKRGQRPVSGIYVTDHDRQRSLLAASGLYAVGFPRDDETCFAAGLDVVLHANRTERSIEVAQKIAAANPRFFATYWRGVGRQVVIQ